MTGDDRSRFCGQCRKSVYNLSALSRADAEALIREREGKLCVRYYQRADGTILTQDCPVGLRALRMKLARTFGAVAAVLGMALTALVALGKGRELAGSQRLARLEPFKLISDKLTPVATLIAPPRQGQWISGTSAFGINVGDEHAKIIVQDLKELPDKEWLVQSQSHDSGEGKSQNRAVRIHRRNKS